MTDFGGDGLLVGVYPARACSGQKNSVHRFRSSRRRSTTSTPRTRPARLTARQLVQGYLDRIDAYDKSGPNINSVITLNPRRAGGGRQARRRLQDVRARRPAARHSGAGQGRDRHRRHADDARHAWCSRTTGRRATRSSIEQAAQGGRDHPRQDHAERVRRRRHLRLDVRRHAQSLRPRAHGRRLVGRLGRGARRQLLDRRHRRGDARLDPPARRPGTRSSACGRRPASSAAAACGTAIRRRPRRWARWRAP